LRHILVIHRGGDLFRSNADMRLGDLFELAGVGTTSYCSRCTIASFIAKRRPQFRGR